MDVFATLIISGMCVCVVMIVITYGLARRSAYRDGGWMDGKWVQGGGWYRHGNRMARIGLDGEKEFRDRNETD